MNGKPMQNPDSTHAVAGDPYPIATVQYSRTTRFADPSGRPGDHFPDAESRHPHPESAVLDPGSPGVADATEAAFDSGFDVQFPNFGAGNTDTESTIQYSGTARSAECGNRASLSVGFGGVEFANSSSQG